MELTEFCSGVGFADEAVRFLRERPVGPEELAAARALLQRGREEFFAAGKAGKDPWGDFLRLYVALGMECHAEYERRGISDEIYYATFSDLPLWEEECRAATGRPGISEYEWFYWHVTLRIFRLGRLQFQPHTPLRELVWPGGRLYPDVPALYVHIPRGGPLAPDAIVDSYRRAAAFFRGVAPVFVCESWLLCPELRELLPPDSNILAFQREFYIFEREPDSRQAEERIFGALRDDRENYPENTSLQRAAKAYLLRGGRLEGAWGVRGCTLEAGR